MEENPSSSKLTLDRELEKKIKTVTGYEFKNPTLLQQAFTHTSYSEHDKNAETVSPSTYERLEFIGDAVLSFFVALEQFLMYPDMNPGQLTRLRAANVDTEKLARVALKHELHKFIKYKKPLLDDKIKDFEDAITSYPLHSYGMVAAPKSLADVVESLIGAIYIDSNSMDTASKILKDLLQPMITPSTLNLHPVTKLYEICQKNKVKIETRDSWKQTGEIEFVVGGESIGKAKYSGKRVIATNRAASEAYHNILKELRLDKD